MVTIPQAVEQIVRQTPFIEEGLSQEIINYSALARLIKPQIEEMLFKDIQVGAIMMALRRLSKRKIETSKITSLLKRNVETIIRSHLIEYTYVNSSTLIIKLQKLLSKMSNQTGYFFTSTQGVFETDIIVSRDFSSEVVKIFSEEKLINTFTNLSAITIRLPEDNVVIPGVYYFILKALAWEGINLTEVVSTYKEFSIILADSEVDKAFSILKKNVSGV